MVHACSDHDFILLVSCLERLRVLLQTSWTSIYFQCRCPAAASGEQPNSMMLFACNKSIRSCHFSTACSVATGLCPMAQLVATADRCCKHVLVIKVLNVLHSLAQYSAGCVACSIYVCPGSHAISLLWDRRLILSFNLRRQQHG